MKYQLYKTASNPTYKHLSTSCCFSSATRDSSVVTSFGTRDNTAWDKGPTYFYNPTHTTPHLTMREQGKLLRTVPPHPPFYAPPL